MNQCLRVLRRRASATLWNQASIVDPILTLVAGQAEACLPSCLPCVRGEENRGSSKVDDAVVEYIVEYAVGYAGEYADEYAVEF